MKKLLKILAFVSAFALVLAFSACGDADDANDAPEAAEEIADDDNDVDDNDADDDDNDADDADDDADGDDDFLEWMQNGYNGTDPVEAAVYEYLADEVSEYYEEADASIPVVKIIKTDDSDKNDIQVKGAFWIYNYKIEGDTLKCVSGGAHPGCMHIRPDGGEYEAFALDQVEDGSNYDPSAKKIFGDDYDAFIAAEADDDDINRIRYDAVTAYVNSNGIPCTKYQDEGQEPVNLHL